MLEALAGRGNLVAPLPPPGPGEWSTLPAGITAYLGRAVAFGDNIFIFGGWNPSTPSNSIRKYNIISKTWTTAGTLPWAGDTSVAGIIEGLIYVHGGGGSGATRFGNLIAFNPVNNAITVLTAGLAARAASGVMMQGKLFVFGGETSVPLNSLRCYDPATTSWTTLAPSGTIPEPKYYHGAVVIDGKMYVISGFSSGGRWIKTIDVYDPVQNAWEPSIPLTFGVYGAAIDAIGKRIYVAGGVEEDSNYVTTTRVFDTVNRTWTIVKPMPKNVSHLPSVASGGKLYTFGGYSAAAGGVIADSLLYTPA